MFRIDFNLSSVSVAWTRGIPDQQFTTTINILEPFIFELCDGPIGFHLAYVLHSTVGDVGLCYERGASAHALAPHKITW